MIKVIARSSATRTNSARCDKMLEKVSQRSEFGIHGRRIPRYDLYVSGYGKADKSWGRFLS